MFLFEKFLFLCILKDRVTPPTSHDARHLAPSDAQPNIRFGIPYVSSMNTYISANSSILMKNKILQLFLTKQ